MYTDVDCQSLSNASTKSVIEKKVTVSDETKNNQDVVVVDDDDCSTIITKSSKSVSFNESCNQYYPNYHVTKEYCGRLWYSAEEYRSFKLICHQQAADIVQSKNQYRHKAHMWRQSLGRAYESLLDSTMDITSEELDGYNFATSILSPIEQRNLCSVYAGSGISLGLEHLIVTIIEKEREFRRRELVERIFCVEDCLDISCQDVERYSIRLVSEMMSLTPRLFAREVAMALEKVI